MPGIDVASVRVQDGVIIPVFGKLSIKVSGFAKLLNGVVKFLVTEEESDPFDKTYGTALASLIGGSSNDETYIEEIIEESLEKTRIFFENKRLDALTAGEPLPDDETLSTLEYRSSEIVVDSLVLYVSISNNLGEKSTVKLNLD